jgi:RNA polymerase sigma factor (sigma-70 family)
MGSSAQARKRLFANVVELVSANGSAFKATARRYSLCTADAEDAYQRGLEILMTKAPTEDRSQLRPWLHTVIKHEALAVRRQRERLMAGTEADVEGSLTDECASSPEEEASEKQRAFRTAEALRELKSSELRCMLLKALGYSYDEISAQTGFSWTKVNRSLTEGRKRFFDRFAQIESGKRCDGLRPLLSAACDGEASSEDQQTLATHLRACQSCRAAIRAYRTAPTRLAELLPPGLLTPLLVHKGSWWSRAYESFVAGSGDRAGALGYKVQQVGELLSAQKATAVVASTAALAGGAAVDGQRAVHHDQERPHMTAQLSNDKIAEAAPGVAPDPAPPPPPSSAHETASEQPAAEQSAAEFTPEAGTALPPAAEAASAEPAVPAVSPSPARAASDSAAEFAP